MKLNNIKTWVLNPFMFIAGMESLLLGLVIMAGTGCFGYLSSMSFNGMLDVHFTKDIPFVWHLAEQGITLCVSILVFYPLGLILSRSHIRLIDVAGTLALSRWPMIIVSLFGLVYQPPADPLNNLGSLITVGMIILLFSIWMIALMYNAFRISCNVKDGKAVGGFIAGLLISEIVSAIIFFQLYQHFLRD